MSSLTEVRDEIDTVQIQTLISWTDLGGTDPLLGTTAMGLSPEYLILNSPDFEPWLNRGISLDITLLFATTFPKDTGPCSSRMALLGPL